MVEHVSVITDIFHVSGMVLSNAVSPISSPHLSPQGSPLISRRRTPPLDPTLASNGHSHTPPNRLVQVNNILFYVISASVRLCLNEM